jgi:1A family penicillin-binding protein
MSSRRERMQRQTRGRSKAGVVAVRLLVVTLVISLLFTGIGVASAFALVNKWMQNLPDVDAPDAFRVAQTTKVFSADGKLLANLYLENREVVPMSHISSDLVNAVVAVEDERFYEHHGVDFRGVLRAAVRDITVGGTAQGASTLTMQYIRNTVMSNERKNDTLQRKFREAYLALQLEKRYTKEQILHLYLNAVYFGEGAYGVEAASRTFFGTTASKLTLAQASMMAGLPQSPTRLDPWENMAAAKTRQAKVLERMVVNGYITSQEASAAAATKIKLKRIPMDNGVYQAPYFVDYVKRVLQARYNTAVVFKGGLRVYTTLDTRLQTLAEKTVKNTLNRKGDPSAALVAIDPKTGYIKAMYGGKDYKHDKFNLATQAKRQPGSSFKTFVLVTAVEAGYPPYRGVDSGSPAVIPAKPKPWVVSNSEGSGSGYIAISTAIRNSVNVVFARLIKELGAAKVARTAKRMGIMSPVPSLLSIALGGNQVTPLDMASAYGTLANNGIHNTTTSITKIVDADGKVIYSADPKGTRALTPAVSGAVTDMLRGVITGGTGTAADFGRPAAGKTGTSQEYRDAWFVGYTPQMVTSVWVGYSDAERPMRDVHGIRVFGGTFPAQIWRRFMSGALQGTRVLSFPSYKDPKYKWLDSWRHASPPAKVASSTVNPPTNHGNTPHIKPKPKPKPPPPPPPPPPPQPPPPPPPTSTP